MELIILAKWNSEKKKSIKSELMNNVGFYTCSMCFESSTDSDFVHLDHILPRKLGGKDVIENMDLLCKKCNLSRGARTGFDKPRLILNDMEKQIKRISVKHLNYEMKHNNISEKDLREFEKEVTKRINDIKNEFLLQLKKVNKVE